MTIFLEHRAKWISYLFILLSLILLSLSIGKGREWNPAEKLVIEITAPFQKIFTGTISTARNIWKNYFFLVETRQQNLRLNKKIDLLEIENSRYQELLLANQRLQQLLKFQENTEETFLPARVIGWDSSALFKSIIISKGENDGLKINMPVVNSKGVVGRIVSISPNYAKVLLVTDQNSAVDGLVQRSRCRGMLKGRGSSECFFDYVIKACDIETGDVIVTSGLGRAFPKGLYLGTVKRIDDSPDKLFKDVVVVSSVDFSKLEEILVILRPGFIPGEQIND
ncbi:MAG: rod shape-determining protein MreC [Deltaproteobacteria bacterium]|nr:rod shape-determining protein MreC [Deltaproteobacteria bacterium]MBW2332387.1 rod shape-determining protein MreC [Deltaproteobacteria bacterium]MCD6265121.1 rod shape-determining protein MreC [Deltaproteobacteria bacterium]RLB23108.1 MAG: rod shape-determining protein MreC [Deltaproteobacteria bacterium]RLJ05425.1 MAG: rod shape-determining protein MreC [Candidatus Aenigmarchaeota archaeon]